MDSTSASEPRSPPITGYAPWRPSGEREQNGRFGARSGDLLDEHSRTLGQRAVGSREVAKSEPRRLPVMCGVDAAGRPVASGPSLN